jgi:hypothetical protein
MALTVQDSKAWQKLNIHSPLVGWAGGHCFQPFVQKVIRIIGGMLPIDAPAAQESASLTQ